MVSTIPLVRDILLTSPVSREIGTLNDFRDFFGLKRHKTFEEISKNTEVQNALRDLYDHPDKVELYPGVFCESSQNKELEDMDLDPGPSDLDSALWSAIFSDAITLVRSDRFYTVVCTNPPTSGVYPLRIFRIGIPTLSHPGA